MRTTILMTIDQHFERRPMGRDVLIGDLATRMTERVDVGIAACLRVAQQSVHFHT